MLTLLASIFLVELLVQLINSVRAATFNNLLWTLYNFFPTPTSKAVSEQRKLQKEYLRVRTDLRATSSQDEFARWAKLRRQHDKLLAQLEQMNSSLTASRNSFDSAVTAMRWIGTRGLKQFMGFWYRKQAMFWLPAGWFPYYAEWIMSWPSAPLGSISIAMWQWACAGIVTLFIDTIQAVIVLATAPKVPKPSPAKPAATATTTTSQEKKDL